MELIKIGETKSKTVLDMVLEMAQRQNAEMERLKVAAQSRAGSRIRQRARRCTSATIQR